MNISLSIAPIYLTNCMYIPEIESMSQNVDKVLRFCSRGAKSPENSPDSNSKSPDFPYILDPRYECMGNLKSLTKIWNI